MTRTEADSIQTPDGYWVPNYAKPGMRERVERDAFDAECAANPPRSNIDLILRAQQIARFERQMAGRTS